MKRALITLSLLFAFGISAAQESTKPLMIAHRGGWTDRNITNADGTVSGGTTVSLSSYTGGNGMGGGPGGWH